MEFKKPSQDDKVIDFDDKEVLKELEDVVVKSVKETEEKEEFDAYLKMEKGLKKIEELPPKLPCEAISNRVVLDAVSILSNNISLYINRNTVEINAESANDNIIIKYLSALRSDILELKSRSFKILVAKIALFFFLGVCVGFLDHVWMPYAESLGGFIKASINFFR